MHWDRLTGCKAPLDGRTLLEMGVNGSRQPARYHPRVGILYWTGGALELGLAPPLPFYSFFGFLINAYLNR